MCPSSVASGPISKPDELSLVSNLRWPRPDIKTLQQIPGCEGVERTHNSCWRGTGRRVSGHAPVPRCTLFSPSGFRGGQNGSAPWREGGGQATTLQPPWAPTEGVFKKGAGKLLRRRRQIYSRAIVADVVYAHTRPCERRSGARSSAARAQSSPQASFSAARAFQLAPRAVPRPRTCQQRRQQRERGHRLSRHPLAAVIGEHRAARAHALATKQGQQAHASAPPRREHAHGPTGGFRRWSAAWSAS